MATRASTTSRSRPSRRRDSAYGGATRRRRIATWSDQRDNDLAPTETVVTLVDRQRSW